MTKSEILTEVNARTSRSETNIDTILEAVILDFQTIIPVVFAQYTTSSVSGQANYSVADLPAGDIISVKTGTNSPLIKISDFRVYQQWIEDETSSDYDEPEYYIIVGDVMYLYPTPDDVYTITITVAENVLDADNIYLPDYYKEGMIEGACFKLYESKGLASTPQAQSHLVLYRDQLNKLETIERRKQTVGKTAYNDVE